MINLFKYIIESPFVLASSTTNLIKAKWNQTSLKENYYYYFKPNKYMQEKEEIIKYTEILEMRRNNFFIENNSLVYLKTIEKLQQEEITCFNNINLVLKQKTFNIFSSQAETLITPYESVIRSLEKNQGDLVLQLTPWF